GIRDSSVTGVQTCALPIYVAQGPEAEARRVRTRALVRHARAVDAIFAAQETSGGVNPAQLKELQTARQAFEEVRPYGSHDAEARTGESRVGAGGCTCLLSE